MSGQTANDALNDVMVDHKKQQIPIGVRSTDGLWATLDYQQAQITALADYIDGKRTDVKVTPAKSSTPEKVPVNA